MKSHANPFKSDVFSLGLCFVYVICFRRFTTRNRSFFDPLTFKEILKQWLSFCSQIVGHDTLIMSTLRSMLEVDPKDRPDFVTLKLPLLPTSINKAKSQCQLEVDDKII